MFTTSCLYSSSQPLHASLVHVCVSLLTAEATSSASVPQPGGGALMAAYNLVGLNEQTTGTQQSAAAFTDHSSIQGQHPGGGAASTSQAGAYESTAARHAGGYESSSESHSQHRRHQMQIEQHHVQSASSAAPPPPPPPPRGGSTERTAAYQASEHEWPDNLMDIVQEPMGHTLDRMKQYSSSGAGVHAAGQG